MWLPVTAWLLTLSAARCSDLCRPLETPEPDTERVTVVEGGVARLPCRLDARRAFTTWSRNRGRNRGRLIALALAETAYVDQRPGSERYRVERGLSPGRRSSPQWVLVIAPVMLADAGLYHCYALYERPELDNSRRQIRLAVLPAGGARLAGPRSRAVPAGGPLTLSCEGLPPLSWLLDGHPVSGRVTAEGPSCSRLRVAAVTAGQAGVYTCRDGSGEVADSVRVAVVTEVGTVVEMRRQSSGTRQMYSSSVLVILALCCQYCASV